MIPFEAINTAALAVLPQLLAEWLPHGKRRGNEYVAGDLLGSEGESLSINVRSCQWADFADDSQRGGDPISLFAAIYHAGDRVAAARDLGTRLGVYLNGDAYPVMARAPPAHIIKPEAEPKAQFESSPPPIHTAIPAPCGGADAVWTYRDSNGMAQRYVVRKALARGKKLYFPVTWGALGGVTGWHKKHPSGAWSLYGLDRLAENPELPVIICEGEKAADAAHDLCPDYVAISWSGGTANVGHADWAPLAGRTCIVWPDNDEPGARAGREVAAILEPLAASVCVLRVDDLLAKGDAADVTEIDIPGRMVFRAPDPEPVLEYEGPPPDYPAEDTHQQPLTGGVTPLGVYGTHFYYFSHDAMTVQSLSASEHTRLRLQSLASLTQFWERSNFMRKKGVDWNAAAGWLTDQCNLLGPYDGGKVRGRGAWLDEGRAVLHLGDQLLVDGRPVRLGTFDSTYIYERAAKLATGIGEPMTDGQGAALIDLCGMLRWRHGRSGLLFAGWLALAPICGALEWRPSLWLTGPKGSGKTWIGSNIIRPALGALPFYTQGVSTEAGIRAAIGSDARPVIFDEAEGEDAEGADRMQRILALMRQGSSESVGAIAKGSVGGKEAVLYRIRSPFLFSSINTSIKHEADASRLTLCELEEKTGGDEHFQVLRGAGLDLLTADFSGALLSRSLGLLSSIRENAETFSVAIAMERGSRREGDQLGALLSGAYSLKRQGLISLEAAKRWVGEQDWSEEAHAEGERDEVAMLTYLLTRTIRISYGNGGGTDNPVGRLILAARGRVEQIPSDAAEASLWEHGIRSKDRGAWFSVSHPAIRAWLRGTAWASGHSVVLKRLPGAESSGGNKIRFALGHKAVAVWVPDDLLLGEDYND